MAKKDLIADDSLVALAFVPSTSLCNNTAQIAPPLFLNHEQ